MWQLLEKVSMHIFSLLTQDNDLVPESSTDVPDSELEDIQVTSPYVQELLLNLDAQKRFRS